MNWELIMISSDKENLIWEVLQVRTQQSLKWALQLQNQLRDIQKQVSDICIYRPIKAYKMIKTLSFEVGKLEKEITNVVEELQKIIMLAPDNNMGNILSSCLDTIRLATKSHIFKPNGAGSRVLSNKQVLFRLQYFLYIFH